MTQTSAFHFESLVWDWPIAIYLFLIGISAGLVTLAVLLRRFYPQAGGADSTLLRTTLIVGPGAVILGLLILVFHLTRPWTFWKLMFHYSFTSVMSMGVMLFQLYMVVLLLWLAKIFEHDLLALQQRWLPKLGFVQKVLSLLTPVHRGLETLMLVLAVHSLPLPGAAEGLKFYLVPDFGKIDGSVVVGAMNQAFFTLSVGMGGMAIFGSYIEKEHSLMGESVHIIVLDTLVAVLAGIIMFPACFTYGLEVNAGPSLLFDTMATVFNNMTGGRWWGTLFFLFMVFAALSTVLGVCENILAMVRELTGLSRPKGALLCGVGIFLLALTTALGYSVLHFQPFAAGTAWLDLWDFIVSNNILPLGSLVLALFCCNSFGWGWDAFVQEANTGKGLKVQPWMKPIFRFVVPAAIAFIYIYGMATFAWN